MSIQEDFEELAKSKGMSVERTTHLVGIDYYKCERTLFMWTGYSEGRKVATGIGRWVEREVESNTASD